MAQELTPWPISFCSFGSPSQRALAPEAMISVRLFPPLVDPQLERERRKEEARRHDAGQPEAARAVTDARAEIMQWEKTLREAESELSRLEEERLTLQSEPMDDAQVQARLNELAVRIRGAEQEWGRLEEQLRGFPADLEQQFERLKKEATTYWDQLHQTQRDVESIRLRLAEQQGTATYSALAEKEAELEEKRRQLAAVFRPRCLGQ